MSVEIKLVLNKISGKELMDIFSKHFFNADPINIEGIDFYLTGQHISAPNIKDYCVEFSMRKKD